MARNNIINLICICLLFLLIPARGFTQKNSTCITGARIHTGDGSVIETGYISYKNGFILEVASGEPKERPADVTFLDMSGKDIYPGLFCLNTWMGLNEVDAVRATRDYSETGMFNPNARTLIAYNTDSKILPTALVNGITYAQVIPTGGLISGSSSILSTSAWNWEDAQLLADDGIHLNWPEVNPWGDLVKQQERLNKEIQLITDFFVQSEQYCSVTQPDVINLRFEAMRGLFKGSKRLYIHVSGEEGIVRSIQFCENHHVSFPVLVGAEGSYQITEFIKSKKVPVILNLTHRLPKYAHEDIDLPFKLPALLMKAGITVAIGNSGSWESRNVMFQAGNAVPYGLSKEEALMCITSNAAAICGSDGGVLKQGKRATFVINDGDILDMKTNRIERIAINGEWVDDKHPDQQMELYMKYRKKYGF